MGVSKWPLLLFSVLDGSIAATLVVPRLERGGFLCFLFFFGIRLCSLTLGGRVLSQPLVAFSAVLNFFNGFLSNRL